MKYFKTNFPEKKKKKKKKDVASCKTLSKKLIYFLEEIIKKLEVDNSFLRDGSDKYGKVCKY